jgi:hypothetical protein
LHDIDGEQLVERAAESRQQREIAQPQLDATAATVRRSWRAACASMVAE